MTAVLIISESEIAKVITDWNYQYPENHQETFKNLLWGLGINVNMPVEKQEGFCHRNRFNEVVLCNRWVGYERLDEDWIKSGYASREAKNESSQSRILKDLLSKKIPNEIFVDISKPEDFEVPENSSEENF